MFSISRRNYRNAAHLELDGKPAERCGVSWVSGEQAWGRVKTRVAQTAGLDYSEKSVFVLAGLEWFWWPKTERPRLGLTFLQDPPRLPKWWTNDLLRLLQAASFTSKSPLFASGKVQNRFLFSNIPLRASRCATTLLLLHRFLHRLSPPHEDSFGW